MSLFQKNLLLSCFFLAAAPVFAMDTGSSETEAVKHIPRAPIPAPQGIKGGLTYPLDKQSRKILGQFVKGNENLYASFCPRFNTLIMNVTDSQTVEDVSEKHGTFLTPFEERLQQISPKETSITFTSSRSLADMINEGNPAAQSKLHFVVLVPNEEGIKKMQNLNQTVYDLFTEEPSKLANLIVEATADPRSYLACMTIGKGLSAENAAEVAKDFGEKLGTNPLKLSFQREFSFVKFDINKHAPIPLSDALPAAK